MPTKAVACLMKPRNLRIIVLTLALLTITYALYHLYLSASYESSPSPIPTVDVFVNYADQNSIVEAQRENTLLVNKYANNNNVTNWSVQRQLEGDSIAQQNGINSKTKLEIYNKNFILNESLYRQECPVIPSAASQIDSTAVYQSLGFDEDWIRTREYWNVGLEKRYLDIKKSKESPYMKVFVIPHSHNDPGWLRTFEQYYFAQTKNILDNLVEKLTEYKNMTFLWTEMSFLNKWWQTAHPSRKDMFRTLVAEKRLEITTGGWVMTDEATVNLYSMIDQLVEGHQWIKHHLGEQFVSKSSWSIDPFGHGSTLPYILRRSGITSMVIQRIHYAWKKWFAVNQAGDFEWVQRWDDDRVNSIFCHNAPFDIYSIKHSCGPHPHICLNFDFRNIHGEYGENYRVSVPINKANVKQKAELLLEQYGKTASLFPHNIAMISLGDDFRFDKPQEWDQQYTNYMQLFDFVNANRDYYRAELQFGTISDYFKAVKERQTEFPTFSGDFFVYSDIFSEGRPAYWSGYFGTRPFYKKFYRETENNVRSAELLFTVANTMARQSGNSFDIQVFNQEYNKLVIARQWLALFAHHDASTGTSKINTMEDYGIKLMEATQFSQSIQMAAVNTILYSHSNATPISTDYESDYAFGQLPRKIPLEFARRSDGKEIAQKVVLFNSLSWERNFYAKVVVTTPFVQVIGPDGKPVLSQLNPILDMSTESSAVYISHEVFELTFLAKLPPLSLSVYQIKRAKAKNRQVASRAAVYCRNCSNPGKHFEINKIQEGDIQLNNENLQLLFDRTTGGLLSVTKTKENFVVKSVLKFGGYSSIDFRSGAYLLMLDTRTEQKIPFAGTSAKIFIISGPISSEVSVFHAPITMNTRIMHIGGGDLEEGIFIENKVDLGRFNGEIFMRIQTDLNSLSGKTVEGRKGVNNLNLNIPSEFNGGSTEEESFQQQPSPTFYTDQNGFSIEKRVKIEKIRLEGNYYPVNTMSFIQDEEKQVRLSVLVDRSHPFSSFESGRLETLIERRTTFDDSRGMGEGVTDNRPTISNYVLLVEKVSLNRNQENSGAGSSISKTDYANSLPTLKAIHLSQELNYQPSLFVYQQPLHDSNSGDATVRNLFTQTLPCDTHVLNLRTITNLYPHNENFDIQSPSKDALLILQKFAFNCNSKKSGRGGEEGSRSCGDRFFYPNTFFETVEYEALSTTDLTGVSSSRNRSSKFIKESPRLSQLHDLPAKPLDLSSIIIRWK